VRWFQERTGLKRDREKEDWSWTWSWCITLSKRRVREVVPRKNMVEER
jgi:hypothetical protein